MRLLIAGLRRLAKLFVDDNRFACAIAAWLLVSVWLLPRLPLAPETRPLPLFLGLAVILLAGAHWAAYARRAGR